MGIKINWTDFNTAQPDEFRIYRSSSPIDPLNPPAPLAAVGGNLGTYEDTTTVRNTVYYYMVSAFTAGKGEVFSKNICAGYFPYTGPGPQTLLRGDFNSGYFGVLTVGDFFTATSFKTAVAGPGTVNASATHWIKVASRGKILFIPNHPIATAVTFEQLFAAGLVYSGIPQEDWPTQATVGRTLVAQNKTIVKNDDVFNVRLLSSRKDRKSNSVVLAEYSGGDFDLGFTAMHFNCADLNHADQLCDLTPPTAYSQVHTGDFAGSNIITRTVVTNEVTVPGTATSSANLSWLPALELIL
jgi:hypothetical protein